MTSRPTSSAHSIARSASGKPLEIQPTAAERAWWAEARKPFRRRALLVSSVLVAGLVVLPPFLIDPARFLAGGWIVTVPVTIAIGAICQWASWRLQERWLMPGELVGKRIREELLAVDDERSASRSEQDDG